MMSESMYVPVMAHVLRVGTVQPASLSHRRKLARGVSDPNVTLHRFVMEASHSSFVLERRQSI